MCDYCEGSPIVDEDYICAMIERVDDVYYLGVYSDWDGKKEINYCPMCGKKLRED